MISAKDLSAEQKEAIAQWAAEGAQLAGIQKSLKEEFDLNLTYMDTRFLVLDLGLELQSEEPSKSDESALRESSPGLSAPKESQPGGRATGAGGVKVTTDEIARAGALVSGLVTFSDGERAVWLIDQMGRLGLDPDTPGYQPNEADAIAFERELRQLLERDGGG